MSDRDDSVFRELKALRARVGVLERSLSLLVQELTSNGTIDGHDPRPISHVSPAEMEEALESGEHVAAQPATSGSAYRDGARAAITCSSCGKAIERDDPELMSASGRRVCTTCFQRGA
jgi:hypothetical protein